MRPVWEALTVDARDPSACADWWAATLGWDVVSHGEGVEIRPPDARGPSLFFIQVTEPRTTAKNRLHIDLSAADRAAAVAELEARGARRVDIGQGDVDWTVLCDPEGNEFCVLDPPA